jgi:hypothetical protein
MLRFSRRFSILSVLVASLSTPAPSSADTVRAACAFADSPDAPRTETTACSFSQRQGHIRIEIDAGPTLELSPTGEGPGNFTDQEGRAVYRRSGLGKRGQAYQLPGRYLQVYWKPDAPGCSAADLTSSGGCTLVAGELSFHLRVTGLDSAKKLLIQTQGLKVGDPPFEDELDGTAGRAEIADLDGDGWPELYVYVSASGSGRHGSLIAYAVNNGKSMTRIYLRPLTEDATASMGYMGRDEFEVVENRLVRRFPIRSDGDAGSEPSGITRQLEYRLTPGEAGWVLELDGVLEY